MGIKDCLWLNNPEYTINYACYIAVVIMTLELMQGQINNRKEERSQKHVNPYMDTIYMREMPLQICAER